MTGTPSDADDDPRGDQPRSRILRSAADLIAAGGADAATTRAVAGAAAVQAPTIYRLFGDKQGLLDAVAEHGYARHVAAKARREPHADPVQDLRDGWDAHISFGLQNPGLAVLVSGTAAMGRPSRATLAGLAVLRDKVGRVARSGRLRVGEARAVELIHAMGTGVVLTLLAAPDNRGDPPVDDRDDLSVVAREAVMAAILDEDAPQAGTGPAGMASALHACLDRVDVLTPGERHLLDELLQRIAGGSRRRPETGSRDGGGGGRETS